MRKLYFTLAIGIFTVGFSSKTISQSVDSYDPIRFGIPETIGGYRVLAVLTGDNFTCMKGREKRLVLQSPQPSIKDGPRDFPKELIEQELRAPNLIESTHWEWSIVGPGVTREQLVNQYEQSHRFFNAHGCPALDLPDASGEEKCPFITGNELIGGEARCPPPYQGYAILRNLIADEDLGNNGQSVILIAPSVGNNHGGWTECDITRVLPCLKYDGYSAFLNNGVTDEGYFLQVGLYFTDRPDPLHPFRGSPPISECVNLAEPAPGNPFSPEGIG